MVLISMQLSSPFKLAPDARVFCGSLFIMMSFILKNWTPLELESRKPWDEPEKKRDEMMHWRDKFRWRAARAGHDPDRFTTVEIDSVRPHHLRVCLKIARGVEFRDP
jgi:hypothetical protein